MSHKMTKASTGTTLPADFADLEQYVESWALPTQQLRNDRRTAATIEELDSFYNALLPRVKAIAEHIDQYPLTAMPAHAVRLLDLARMLMEIAPAVEVMRSPDVVCEYARERLIIHQIEAPFALAAEAGPNAQGKETGR